MPKFSKVSRIIAQAFLAITLITSPFVASIALAAPSGLTDGINGSAPTGASTCLFAGTGTNAAGSVCTAADSIFSKVANVLIFIIGAVAVIMLIIGGLRYVLSSGNSSAVEGAKNTILYAIIGIVVASLAFAAVNFVVGKL